MLLVRRVVGVNSDTSGTLWRRHVLSRGRPYRIGHVSRLYSGGSAPRSSPLTPSPARPGASRPHNNAVSGASQGRSLSYQSILSQYEEKRRTSVVGEPPAYRTSPDQIFATGETRLGDISVVGFDYDFTLASYTPELQHLIYNLAKEHLIHFSRYPDSLSTFSTYDPDFPVRGLWFDRKQGLLMKLNYVNRVTEETVFRGRTRLSVSETEEVYQRLHIPLDYRRQNMRCMVDLFSLSEVCLLADTIEYFVQNKIPYDPGTVHDDVAKSFRYVHKSGRMHNAVMQDLPKYLFPAPELTELLEMLKNDGKELFLLSNSSFKYIDSGLRYLIGDHWRTYFDLTLVSSAKPEFYVSDRPFRLIDPDSDRVRWDVVSSDLTKGSIYSKGNVKDLVKATGWWGPKVLYIGDHLATDLTEPSRTQGWTTGAIIRELEDEILVQNTDEYRELHFQFRNVEQTLASLQARSQNCPSEVLDELEGQRRNIRVELGRLMNRQFGSVFRTQSNPSSFGFNIMRYVDLYTSRVENFLNYRMDHRFYPQRRRLPHEPSFSTHIED